MKNSSSDPPRLICRLVRLQCSLQENLGFESARCSRHVEHCQDCQRFFRAAEAWEATLRRDAAGWTEAAPVGLEQRIARAVRLSSPSSRRPAWSGRLVFSLAGFAGVACALFLIYQGPAVDEGKNSPALSPNLTVTESLPQRWWSALKPSATRLAEETSLERELDSVYFDAQSAVAFLALNFLPSPVDEKGRGERERTGFPQRG